MAEVKDVKLVVVGSIGLDTIETPVERRAEVLGGSVSYACAAASFFVPVGMVGVVGSDFPRPCLELYNSFGIDVQGLQQVDGETFRWSGVYEADMNRRRTLETRLNVYESFSPELPPAYRVSPYLFLGNISPTLQWHVLAQMKKPRFVAADTMNLWIDTTRKELLKLLKRIQLLLVNESEALELTGERNLVRAAGKILEYGPRYVIVKKGEHGAFLFSRSGLFVIPAFPVEEVRDPTGAGDSFAGGFMGALALGGATHEKAIRMAMAYGTVLASFGVEAFSLDRMKGLSRRTITARLNALKRMVRFA